MNKQNNNVFYHIKKLSHVELSQLYGIEILENNSVFDSIENKTFNTLTDWAQYFVEANNDTSNFHKTFKSSEWDDLDDY